MKNIKLIMVLVLVLSTFTGVQASKLTFKVINPVEQTKVVLTFSQTGEQKEVTIDAAGNGTFEFENSVSQYVTIQYGRGLNTLYLDPKQDLMISFNGESVLKFFRFEGPIAAINTYLNGGKLKSLGMPDIKMQETAFIQRGDSLYKANCVQLENANLPKDFTQKEKIRLLYYTYYYYPKYVSYHGYLTKTSDCILSAAYYEKLKSLTAFDSKLLSLREYQSFLPDAISALSTRGMEDEDNVTLQCVNYVDATIKDAKIAQFLIDYYVYSHVDNNGLDDTSALLEQYHKYVKDAKLNEKFNTLCAQWEKLKVGNPSPGFSYLDIDGKTVSLADLKGKFIYIDVWATWCGPCRGEIPALKALEQKYEGKDIHFVSISCDMKKEAWESMVKKDELKGIQLHTGGDKLFMNAYFINGIPRFILLDRDGKIISANMSRPSSPKTAAKFNQLLGI